MNMEQPNVQKPDGHFVETGVFVEGPKKPRNVLIERNGEVKPIFGERGAEQAKTKPIDNSGALSEDVQRAFDILVKQEEDASRILKTKKDLGINTRADELRAEEANRKLTEFMNRGRKQ